MAFLHKRRSDFLKKIITFSLSFFLFLTVTFFQKANFFQRSRKNGDWFQKRIPGFLFSFSLFSPLCICQKWNLGRKSKKSKIRETSRLNRNKKSARKLLFEGFSKISCHFHESRNYGNRWHSWILANVNTNVPKKCCKNLQRYQNRIFSVLVLWKSLTNKTNQFHASLYARHSI